MASMNPGNSWQSSQEGLKVRVQTAFFVFVLFVISGSFLTVPFQAHAADCGAPALSAGGYFFTNYENVEYSTDGHLIHHFKISPSWADGRPFRFSWSYYDDECNPDGSLGFSKIISLPPGVTDWSVRFASASHADIWNDQSNTVITGIDFSERPSYTRAAFSGGIDGSASTFNSRTLQINQNGQAPTFTDTLPLPEACSPTLTGSAGGSSPYFFDTYEHAEFVDGLLRVHLRLKSPYNDGRGFKGAATGAGDDCLFTFPFISSNNTSLPAYSRYFSFRMTSDTHWEIWNDETNLPVSCTNCAGDLPVGSKYAVWFASIDGGVSFIKTTPFSPVEHTAPIYAECCSSVVFLPGIKGSVLKIGSDTIWPPTILSNDIPQLALTAGGESVNPVLVDGVLNNFYGTPVYSGFTSFLDGLVTAGTIADWEPVPYDWRYSPEKILTDGVATPTGIVDVLAEIKKLAAESDTGQVTLVAHSMGGLMGKAIIKALEAEGNAGLVDSFVMVGTPQLGTPQAVASLLHGDDESILGGLIVNPSLVRQVAQNMPSSYNLLPSPRYFEEVSDPVVVFDENVEFTADWRNAWGMCAGETFCLNNYLNFFAFLTGGTVARLDPAPNVLRIPEVLDPNLATDAANFHNEYDNYFFPDSIRVVQVAGWGVPTVKAVEYTTQHFLPSYKTLFTTEGDKTVVYPSAVSSSAADETYFFNLAVFNALDGVSDFTHRDLLSSTPVQELIGAIVVEGNVIESNFIRGIKPEPGSVSEQLIVSTHSPVILGAYDALGNFTGVNQGQDLSSDFLTVSEGISGSSFLYSAESQYIFLPKEGTYTFVYKGIGTGPTTVVVEDFSNDIATPIAIYTDIPTILGTSATSVINTANPEQTSIQIDQNGDGNIDTYVASDAGVLSLEQLLVNLTTAVQNLTIKDKLKTQLLNKIAILQKKVDRQKQKQSDVLEKLQAQIQKQLEKGKIDATSADQISVILDGLVSQSTTVPLASPLLDQLKEQVTVLDVPQSLRKSLLAKVTRLENLTGILKSLNGFVQIITHKGNNGQIADVDVQNVLNILDQIQGTL